MCTLPPGVSDAMRRFYGEYPPTVLVPHSFLPASLQIHRLDEKLARVCRVLQRASGVTLVAERCPLTHKVHAQLRALHNVTTEAAAPFHFYLGGGFILQALLSVGTSDDIDVWTRPNCPQSRPDAMLVACGKTPYPVTVLAVNKMDAFIESLDLHIFCCAVLCCVLEGCVRGYELYMTKNCAVACSMRRAHACALHGAMSCPAERIYRVRAHWTREIAECKYGTRWTSTAESDHVPLAKYADVMEAIAMHSCPQGSCSGFWVLELSRQGIHGITFRLTSTPPARVFLPASEPALLYACSAPASTSAMDIGDEEGHWILQSMTRPRGGRPSLVAFRGGSRIWSTWLLPTWLWEKLGWTERDVVREIGRCVPGVNLQYTTVAVPCTRPLHMLGLLANWNSEQTALNANKMVGVHTWCYCLDAPDLPRLPTQMFCRVTKQVCTACKHDVCVPYLLHATHDW